MRGDMKQTPVRTSRTVREAINWIVAGTLVGVTGGALFGALWGALVGLLQAEPWLILSATAYFGLCGATAGGVVGAYRGIFDRPEAHPRGNSPGEEDLLIRITGIAAVFREPKTPPDPDRKRNGGGEEPPQ
jgi:hypothetical protein